MAIIQLVTLPGSELLSVERNELVPMAKVVRDLVDVLPDLLVKHQHKLGLGRGNGAEQFDVEHRESGYSNNPADLRVIGMFREEQPGLDERHAIDGYWHDILIKWVYEQGYEPIDIIDIKLIFGC